MSVEDDRAEMLRQLSTRRTRKSERVPLYLQAGDAIRRVIQDMNVPPGFLLPAENDLANALGVSRPTIRQAISELSKQALIHTQRGVGTFTTPAPLVRPLRLASLYTDMQSSGQDPRTRLVYQEASELSSEDAAELGLEPGISAVTLCRVRYSGDRPIAIITNTLALGREYPFTTEQLESRGLYELLHSELGIELVMANQHLSARLSAPEEERLLSLPRRSALLVNRRFSFDAQGRGIEASVTLYPEGTEITTGHLVP